ncbi:MAG: M23 family metallopeptidase [Patescibacteria group bacterium]
MKKNIGISILLVMLLFLVSACSQQAVKSNQNITNNQIQNANRGSAQQNTNVAAPANMAAPVNTLSVPRDFIAPISGALVRITKKPFGLYVTQKNSPVQPEKFSGYHTGVDFETTVAEADADVRITAACTGKVRVRQWVSGYGGVLIQDCMINGQSVTVLYGHLNVNVITASIGDILAQGDFIGNLGQGFSPETDGERKHLHLGIHAGTSINYKGYVSSQDQLIGWQDAEKYLI